jgi:hypothetical protein
MENQLEELDCRPSKKESILRYLSTKHKLDTLVGSGLGIHFLTSIVEDPTSNAGRTTFQKNQEREKRIIFDSVKDHIMHVISPLKIEKECFDTLFNLYEKKAPSQKRVLKNKL